MESNQQKIEIAGTIREVFAYISRFRGQVFVLKIEDSLMDHPLFPVLIRDVAQLHKAGIRILIVPGTRRSIDRHLLAYEVSTEFHQGVRLTSSEALPLVEQASLGAAQRILSHLTANGCNGIQGNWVQARSMGIIEGIDYMRTGTIEKIQKDILDQLLDDGFIPLLPPIGWNKIGHAYNLSSTELATALCGVMHVGKLFFIGSEDGIRAEGLVLGPQTGNLETTDWGIISALDIGQAEEILELNGHTLKYAQQDYLINAIRACRTGANRVHLVSGISEGSILQEVFSSRGDGTMVYINQYSSLRSATVDDIPDMLRIMQDYILRGFLISRTQEDILDKLADYTVYEVDNAIHGCGALHSFEDGQGEIAGIAVGITYRRSGVGEIVVKSLIEKAKQAGMQRLFLLTTQARDWFYQLGFVDGTIDDLPPSKQAKYDRTRNSRILLYPLQETT